MKSPLKQCLAFVAVACSAVSMAACGGPAPASDAPAATAMTADGAPVNSAPAVAPLSPPQAGSTAPAPTSGGAAAPAAALPVLRDVVIPAGTVLKVRLTSDLASDTSKVEDPVRATLATPVSVSGEVAIPDGSPIAGSVLSVQRSAKVKGRASLTFRFERLSLRDEDHDVRTERITRLARATKRRDATKVGIGAGAGAVVGAIAGGGKGAAIGSAIGAGAGGGVVMATRGDEVRLPAGTIVTTKLTESITVRVPAR